MTTPELSPYAAVDPMVFALNWFKPLGPANAIGAKRWATRDANNAPMPLPYRWFTVFNTSAGQYLTRPVVRAHTIAATYTDAAREAKRTDARAQLLVDYPGYEVTVGGLTVRCQYAEILQWASEEPYAAETVATRFVSEYRFGFSLVAA